MRRTHAWVWVGIALLSALPAAAQATGEVKGKVVDEAGKPIPGAVITLVNKVNAATNYKDTSDKRGSYWLPAVLYNQAAPMWEMKIEAAGYHATKAKVESRNSTNTLLTEPYEKKMAGRGGSLDVKVAAYGTLTVDFTLAEGDEPQAGAPVAGAPSGATPGAGGPKDAYQQALDKIAQGDVTGSTALLQASIDANPADPERREVYAKVLGKLERYAEAEQVATAAAEVAPQRAEPRMILADLRAAQGDFKKASAYIDEARKLDPTNVKILERVSRISTQTGDVDAAIAANEAIVATNPQSTETWLALGELYNRKKETAKAEAAFRKVTEIDPANAYKTFFNIGAVIENRSNLTEADNRKVIEAFRKAIEIKPDYAVAHRHLGYALLRLGDIDGARGEFEKYLQLAPTAKDAAEIRETVRSLGPAQPVKKKG